MVHFHLCLNASSMKTFSSRSRKPRRILAKVSLRLANLMKNFIQWNTVCSCDINCILTYFLSCFCFYLSCKHFPKVKLAYREVFWFSFSKGVHICCVPAVFQSPSGLFPFSYEGHLSISAISPNLLHSTDIFQVK